MIFRAESDPIEIPSVDVPTFVFEHARSRSIFGRDPNLTAIVDGHTNQSLSFSDLEKLSDQFASGLVNSLGLARGNVVALFLPNTIYYPVVAFGTLMAGGVVTTSNPNYTALELSHQLKDSGAKVIVTLAPLLPLVQEAIRLCKSPSVSDGRIVVIDQDGGDGPAGRMTTLSFNRVLSKRPYNRLMITNEHEAGNTLAYICYSSGTTGLPKGVMLTHRNIVANIAQNIRFEVDDRHITAVVDRVPRPKSLGLLPFFHIFGLTVIIHLGLAKGQTIVVMSKFDFESLLRIIERYSITFAHLVPPVFLALANSPLTKKYNLSSLHFLLSGAAPLGEQLQSRVSKLLDIPVTQGYGLTETSPVITRMPMPDVIFGSIGKLVPNIEAKVLDPETGQELGVGQEGEICCRGPNVMKGYFKNKKATDECVDKDGFFHTGDIGYINKDGYWFITDRKKELIKYKGFQIAPAELEALLVSNPDVADSAVIPSYDSGRHSEVPKAYLVLKPHLALSTPEARNAKVQEIVAWLDSRVANHKRLRGGAEIIDAIPKSASGKILRRFLRDREKAKRKAGSTSSKL